MIVRKSKTSNESAWYKLTARTDDPVWVMHAARFQRPFALGVWVSVTEHFSRATCSTRADGELYRFPEKCRADCRSFAREFLPGKPNLSQSGDQAPDQLPETALPELQDLAVAGPRGVVEGLRRATARCRASSPGDRPSGLAAANSKRFGEGRRQVDLVPDPEIFHFLGNPCLTNSRLKCSSAPVRRSRRGNARPCAGPVPAWLCSGRPPPADPH